MLPEYMIDEDLRTGCLVPLLRSTELLRDHFRLVFRSADLRRERSFELAEAPRGFPLEA